LIEAYLAGHSGPDPILMDIRHGPKLIDQQLIEWLNAEGLRWQPVATKADKLSGNTRVKRLREMRHALGGILAPMPVSSLDKRGVEDLRSLIMQEVQS